MPAIAAVTMPKFGLTMTAGKVVSWTIAEGARVGVGDELADIESSKAINAYESPAAGILRRRLAREQQDMPVGALIAVIADEAVSDGEIDAFVQQFQAEFSTAAPSRGEHAPSEPRTVTAGGRSLRYLPAGTSAGTPIVLLHGFGGDLNNWLYIQPALALRHPTYALDLPGHGGSSKDVGAGDLATLARSLVDFLDALDLAQAHLIGHSLGGAVALQAALLRPARAASLSLICSAGLGREFDTGFSDGFIRADRRKLLQPVLERLFVEPSRASRELVEDRLKYKRLDGSTAALSAIAAANYAQGRQLTVLADRVGEITVPVQVIWGAEDRIIPAKHACSLPVSVAVHIIEGAGHMPHLEKPSEVNQLLAAIAA